MNYRVLLSSTAVATLLALIGLAVLLLARFDPNPQSLPLQSLPHDLLLVVILRVALLAALVYLLFAGLLTLLAALPLFAFVRSFAHAITPSYITRMVQLGLALSLATATFPSHAAQAANDEPPTLVNLGPLPQPSPQVPSTTITAPSTTSPPSATPLTATPSATTLPHRSESKALPRPPTHWHTVQRGESFWSIAENHVATVETASASEVSGYWNRLIEANRHELVDPHNPDLIFPGQIFRLPPL